MNKNEKSVIYLFKSKKYEKLLKIYKKAINTLKMYAKSTK